MAYRRYLALAALAVSASARAQDLSQVTVKVVPVAEGIYMLQGGGGNIGLSVGADDAFMVDDQYAPMTPKVKAAIATVTQRPVRFLLNTHWHGDHTGGNENMSGSGALIVAHDNVRKRMRAEQFIEALKQRVPASPAAALPIITFSESISFYVNGDSVRALHVRDAHTDGDAIIFFQRANVVHMGDTFFNNAYPFIDLSSGGSVNGILEAVDKVLSMTDSSTKFIPGHGNLGTRADLVRYRDAVRSVRDRIAKMIADRKTMAQVIAAKPSQEFDDQFGRGFINPETFVTTVYSSLTRATTKR